MLRKPRHSKGFLIPKTVKKNLKKFSLFFSSPHLNFLSLSLSSNQQAKFRREKMGPERGKKNDKLFFFFLEVRRIDENNLSFYQNKLLYLITYKISVKTYSHLTSVSWK